MHESGGRKKKEKNVLRQAIYTVSRITRQPLFDLQLLSFIYNVDFIKVWAQLSRQSRMWMSLVSSLSKHTIWRGLREQALEIYYTSTNVLDGITKERFEKKMSEKCDKCITLVLLTCLSLRIISFTQCRKIVILFAYANWQKKNKNIYIENNQEISVSKSSVCGTWGSIIDSHTVKYSVSAGIKWTRLDVYSVAYILFWGSSFFSSQIFRYAVSFTCEILHAV